MDWERARRGLEHPGLLARGLNRLWHTRGGRWAFNEQGIDVFAEDWDNLVLLDACRLDALRAVNPFAAEVGSRVSRGASTIEFLRGNFSGDLTDVVYVTANPQLAWNREQLDVELHRVIDLWDEEWDDDSSTVLPERVTARAERAAEDYPDKRLVVHYMQPHYPFVDAAEVAPALADLELDDMVWHRVMRGEVDLDISTARDLYRHNLERAMPYVEALVGALDGRTVVSSDHGNMLGHRSGPVPGLEWGHPLGIYVPGLVEVPWVVIEGERRDVERGEAAEQGAVDEEEVHERLRALGYE